MKSNTRNAVLAAGFGGLLVGLLLLSLAAFPVRPALAAPPTQALIAPDSHATAPYLFTMVSKTAYAADTRASTVNMSYYKTLDIQWTVTTGTANTTTLSYDYSNDGVNWVTGETLATVGTTAGTATSMATYFVKGLYQSVYVNVVNTNPITVTVKALAK